MVDRTLEVSNSTLIALAEGQLSTKLVVGVLAIKLRYVNSIMRNASIRNLADQLHCGKDTATEILKEFVEQEDIDIDENKNIDVRFKVHHNTLYHTEGELKGCKRRIFGSQKLHIRNNKVYIKYGDKESKGYDITYRNLKKILLMLIEVNLLKQVKRLQDLDKRCCRPERQRRRGGRIINAKYNDVGKHRCAKGNYHYKHGITFETIAEKMNVSISTAKRITKELALIGAIVITNATNLQQPTAILDYDKAREKYAAIRVDKDDRKNMSPRENIKRMMSEVDPTLVEHSCIMQNLKWSGYRTVKSFVTTKLGSDGEMHTYRYYYAMFANQYKCLV